MALHELTRARARRIAVQAQLLSAHRPTGVEEVIRHLTTVQLEPTSAVAPSADVVLWSRLGSSYAPADLDRLFSDGTLVELRQFVRLSDDIPLFRGEMWWWRTADELPGWRGDVRRWIETNDDCRRDIVDRLELDGPLTTRELPDTCIVPWRSSGWTNNQNVRKMLTS